MRRIAAICCFALALAGCASTDTRLPTEGAVGLLVVPEGMRPQAPELTGKTLDGSTLDLASHRGEIVLLNAFASWCPPCMEELPVLAAADRELPNFTVIGLDVNDTAEAARGVLDAAGADYPALWDPRGVVLAGFTGAPNRGLPISFLIDEQGRVAGRIIGPATAPMLQEAITRIAG